MAWDCVREWFSPALIRLNSLPKPTPSFAYKFPSASSPFPPHSPLYRAPRLPNFLAEAPPIRRRPSSFRRARKTSRSTSSASRRRRAYLYPRHVAVPGGERRRRLHPRLRPDVPHPICAVPEPENRRSDIAEDARTRSSSVLVLE